MTRQLVRVYPDSATKAESVTHASLISAYSNSFAVVQDPLSDGGILVSRDPNSTKMRVLSGPARAVSKQTGTPTFAGANSPLSTFNDAQAMILPTLWLPTQYTVQMTVGLVGGLDSSNREVELLLEFRDDYAQFQAYYGLSTSKGYELNWQHQGAYLICGRYKEQLEIGRAVSPPAPSSGDVFKAEITRDGLGRANIRAWVNATLLTWSVAGGDGITANGGTTLIDTRTPQIYGAPGWGFYRDVAGKEEEFYATNFSAAGI